MAGMEGEIRSFTKAWALAVASGCYCYILGKATRKGIPRLLSVAPVIALFTALPFSLCTVHLGGPTAFYLLWLANFKLLLFAFDQGTLQLPLPLPRFLCLLLLPVKPRPLDAKPHTTWTGFHSCFLLSLKLLALLCVVHSYNYRKSLPLPLVLAFYCFHLYMGLEMTLALSAAFARTSSGLHFTNHFNHPYLTTSLQDFWGYRWNLMASDILRESVHNPIRSLTSPVIGRNQATIAGILASFLVSGLMHELIFYYLTRATPTWEVSYFFILHGLCTSMEVITKKVVPAEWWPHPVISRTLTIAFVAVTGAWLFFPQLLRNELHEKVIDEYPMMLNFFNRNVLNLA